MRILIIAEKFPTERGGLAVSSLRISQGLAADNDVSVFTIDKSVAEGDLVTSMIGDLTVHRVGAFRAGEYSQMTACRVIEMLHAQPPFDAIVGIYLVMAGYIAAFEGKILGIPSLVMARGNDIDRELFRPEHAPFVTGALSMASGVGCVSHELVKKCKAVAGHNRVYYTPNSVDSTFFKPGKADAKLKNKLKITGPVIGFSGELRLKKGMSHVLRAAEELGAADPKLRFILLGGVRKDARKDFDAAVADSKVLRRTIIDPGYIDDRSELLKMYRLMDALFMPSFWEGMPNAALEAMACGVPVVSSTAGALAELVKSGENGFSFSPGDFDSALDALRAILSMNEASRRKMGAKARAAVANKYTLENEIGAIRKVIGRIAK